MDPRIPPPSPHSTASPGLVPSAPPDFQLSQAECVALLRQVKNTNAKGHAILAFLQSPDPGVDMERGLREDLIDQCIRNGNNQYLEDEWPDIRKGVLTVPDHTPLPAFRESHQEEARAKETRMDSLAQLLIDISQTNLRKHLSHLKTELGTVQDKVVALMTDCHPPICERAQRFIESIENRKGAGTLEGCFIGKQVQYLKSQKDLLTPTSDALQALIDVRTGNGDHVSLSMTRSEAFHKEWKRAVQDMEREDWSSFKARLNTLTMWRHSLLPAAPALPPRRLL